ncbi:MAG: hypothetical protein NWF06_10855 [Candidatus Bathyarchaeota archaeon]|nr:hypothetical protein [Candidatus Bathyarchaeum sp.]
MTEAVVVICPNPRCQREIEEPIVLTVLSVTPPIKYEACPYCFAKLEQEPLIENEELEQSIEQNEIAEPAVEQEEEPTAENQVDGVIEKVKDSGPRFLQKVKALIPNNGLNKENEYEIEEDDPAVIQEELEQEPQPEAIGEEELEETIPLESLEQEETINNEPETDDTPTKEPEPSGCPEEFGYLANRPKDKPIPQECLLCRKMVDCMLKIKDD